MRRELRNIHAEAVSRADLKEITARAENCREGIKHILHTTRSMLASLREGQLIAARELSAIITQAEEISLVSRPGMVLSGLRYVVYEENWPKAGENVSAEDGMTTVYHLFLHARRAQNILNHSGGYRPRENDQLYGSAVKSGWQPLIP